jgi:hypothetical protein
MKKLFLKIKLRILCCFNLHRFDGCNLKGKYCKSCGMQATDFLMKTTNIKKL